MEDDLKNEESSFSLKSVIARFEQGMINHQPELFDVSTYETLIDYYDEQQKWGKALEVVNCAISQYPFSATFLLRKASILVVLRRYALAAELVDQAELLAPTDPSVPILRSAICMGQGAPDEAIHILEQAIRNTHNPDDRVELLLEWVDLYEDLHDFASVFTGLERVLRIDPRNEEALSRMWYAVELAEKYEQSVVLHQWILDQDPYSYLAWHNLGNAYFGLKQYKEAIQAFEFATLINEQWDLAYRDCGNAYVQLKNYKQAIAQFQKALEVSKPCEELYEAIGYCYERLKDFPQARRFYFKALDLNGSFHEGYFRIGVTYRRQRQWRQAAYYFEKALHLDPDSLTYLMALAQAYFQLSEWESLLASTQQFMQLPSAAKSKKQYEKLIALLIESGCLHEALELILFATKEKGKSGALTYLAAICYLLLGKRREGLAKLEEGLSQAYTQHKKIFSLCPGLRNDPDVMLLIQLYAR